MSTVTFDTQELVRELRTIVTAHAGLTTKHDLALLEAKLDGKFAVIDRKFDKLSWMMGILIAIAAANFAKQFF